MARLWRSVGFLTALLALPYGRGNGTEASFSGTLERVGDVSLSIRLPDRRVIDALLPNRPALESAALIAQYGMGDRLEMDCKAIQPVWDEGAAHYQYLEVTALRLIRKASEQESAELARSIGFREGKNLLRKAEIPASPALQVEGNGPGSRELAHARLVNLEYAANMPNFVADEKARRFRSSPRSSVWKDFDTVESEITFRGNRAARQAIRRDGKAWNQPFEALPGYKWYEGFGSEISPLFELRCPTSLEYQARVPENGRELLDYRFRTPRDSCFPYFFFTYQRFNPARTGHVFIDDPGGHIIRLDESAGGFPEEIEFSGREEQIVWDYVKIGEDRHLLPVRASYLVSYYDGTRYRIEIEYRNHRHFEATSNLTFQ